MQFADPHEPDAHHRRRLATRSGQNSPNRIGLAMRSRLGYLRILGEVLRAQSRPKLRPATGRKAQGREESCLETTNRMGLRQQVVLQLGLLDDRRVGIRQQHQTILPSSHLVGFRECLTIAAHPRRPVRLPILPGLMPLRPPSGAAACWAARRVLGSPYDD